MGTPDFAVPPLRGLIEHGYHIPAVVTQPSRPRGRGRKITPTPVQQTAAKYGIEVLQSHNVSDPQFCEIIRSRAPDLLVVVAFGQILKKRLLEIPAMGAINLHASLLPRYRGAAPIQWAILNNESVTGLTVMLMNEGLDTGPILLQQELPILPDETAGQLHDRLANLGREVLLKCIEDMTKDRLEAKPQDEAKATYAPKIDRSISQINWHQPAKNVSALIRGLDPWPGAVTTLKNKKIKLFSSQVTDEGYESNKPGRVAGCLEGALQVETKKGIISIRELQMPGKKRLPAKDFLRGFPIDKGTLLE